MKIRIEKIISPNEEIIGLQESLVKEISSLLPQAHVENVGSMAVPMLGRPELDIMVITNDIEKDSKILSENGYRMDPFVNEIQFLKKYVGEVEVGVQVMSPNNKMIGIHRGIIKLLQSDPELKAEYENFKNSLDGLPRDEYKEKKSAWLKENILPRIKREQTLY